MNEITTSKTQVVIIGAGPTGLSMAAHLMRYQIDFIILEKNKSTTQLSKAVVVQVRTLEIFEELGIARTAIQTGRVTNAMNIYNKGKKKVSVNIAGLGQGLTEFPYALSLEQSKTEKLLSDHLRANGKTIRWNCEFERYEENKNGITVYFKNEHGKEEQIDAHYLVSCEGAHSLVRHQMEAKFEGDTIPKLFYVADVTLSSSVINKDELFGFLIKKGFILFFPMEGQGHYRVIGILPDQRDEQFTFKDIEPVIKEKVAVPLEFKELRWFSTYKVHSRMASAFMKGRCFIAGDSAHIHTPAGGQGMNTGIQDGYNLAWKLAYVIHGTFNTSLLETYATERMQNARHLLHTTDRMFDVMAGTTMLRDFIRTHVVPLVANFVVGNSLLNKKIFPLISQTGIAYPDSALTIQSSIGKIKAGDRMPYFMFPDGTSSYNYIKEPTFKILFFGNTPGNFASVKRLGFPVQTYSFSTIPKTVFSSANDFYILLRPDNHILYIGKAPEKGVAVLENFRKQL